MKLKFKYFFFLLFFISFFVEIQAQRSFKVCNVEKATKPLDTASYLEAIKSYMLSQAETVSKQDLDHAPKVYAHAKGIGGLIEGHFNPLVQAVYLAYSDHRPLVLSPDMIWLSLTQGLAIHINENSEKLRKKLVNFEGKKQLDIMGGTSMQALDNAGWANLLPQFESKIAEQVGEDLTKLVSAKFSTTNLNETVAFQVTLMDALNKYFSYSATFMCGVPEVVLEGTTKDWKAIETRIKKFEEYELDWWIEEVKPILKEFTLASKGKINQNFWKSIFQVHRKSVGCYSEEYVSGWITKLFPYIQVGAGYTKNPMLEVNLKQITSNKKMKNTFDDEDNNSKLMQVQVDDFPTGISKAEILCNDNGTFYDIHFYAGFLGITQDTKTLALRPEISWLVYDTGKKPESEKIDEYHKDKQSD